MGADLEQDWLAHLHGLRAAELTLVTQLLREQGLHEPGVSVLEIGAGTGAQARELAALGFNVAAVEVAESAYSNTRVYPVMTYDGRRLPFPDRQFDLVFSSNVLEHLPHLVEFQKEIQRVLADDGLAVHVLPSSAWRFWTSASYYVHGARRLCRGRGWMSSRPRSASSLQPISLSKRLRRVLFPSRHGETGNWFTEVWHFSRSRWMRLFHETGWKVIKCETCGLFYTGNSVLGARLPLRIRRLMATALGSATNVFMLRKGVSQPEK